MNHHTHNDLYIHQDFEVPTILQYLHPEGKFEITGYDEAMPQEFKRNILAVLCTFLIRQIEMEELFDDSLYPDTGGPFVNATPRRLLQSRIGGQLYGNFAPNKNRLWLDENGNAELYYCFGNGTEFDLSNVKDQFQETIEAWGRNTCIRFTNVATEQCLKPEGLTHGVLHIDTFMYKCCSAPFGNQHWLQGEKKTCQKMCLDAYRENCDTWDIRALINHSLGLLSPLNRPDADDYITFHPELINIDMWPPMHRYYAHRWKSLQKCPVNQASVTAPVPYDFLSVRHPRACMYAETLCDVAVIVSRDRTKQYLIDHRYPSCPDLSHFDIYQVNKGYGCDKKIAEQCATSGKTVPKCLNYGYLKRDCTCACSKYYTGTRCEIKTDAPDFCAENAWFLKISNITNRTLYDTSSIGMEVKQAANAGPDFSFGRDIREKSHMLQLLTVTVELADPLKHVDVALRFTKMQSLLEKINDDQYMVIHRMLGLDCGGVNSIEGFLLYWGANRDSHVRTWCFSSFFLNETEPTVLRSRLPRTFDMVFRSWVGITFREAALSVDSLLLHLEVSSFGVMNITDPWPPESSNITDSTGGDQGPDSETWTETEALLSDASPTGVIGAAVMGVVMLAGIALVAFFGWYCNRDSEEDEVSLDRFDGSSDGEIDLD